MSEPPDFTVIIATRNRAESLRETLRSLAAQECQGFTYEVLVVDNGSDDHTAAMLQRMAPDYPVPLRSTVEERVGKPYALNTGATAARGRWLAFTDDDVLVPRDWLSRLGACFTEESAEAVTGRILPSWEGQPPPWMTHELAMLIGALGCVDYGDARRVGRCRWVGGNLAIRREVIERVGGFDVRMARSQDTEYYRRCRRALVKVVYEPSAIVYHKVGAERLTPDYFRRWHSMTGAYHALLPDWRKSHLVTIMPIGWYRQAFRWLGRWVRAMAARRPWGERFVFGLLVRNYWTQWTRRLTLWPRWWLTVLTGRSFLP